MFNATCICFITGKGAEKLLTCVFKGSKDHVTCSKAIFTRCDNHVLTSESANWVKRSIKAASASHQDRGASHRRQGLAISGKYLWTVQVHGNEAPCRGSFSPKTRAVYLGSSRQRNRADCRRRVAQTAATADTTVHVATPPTASEFRRGNIGVTLRPVSGADFVSPITDEHLLQAQGCIS